MLATPLTCTATNWPILANGMKIRWVDTDPETLNIDLDDLARKITPTTRAIVLVHWGGYPVDLDRLTHILDEAERLHGNRPQVIEDCADAFGATYKNAPSETTATSPSTASKPSNTSPPETADSSSSPTTTSSNAPDSSAGTASTATADQTPTKTTSPNTASKPT